MFVSVFVLTTCEGVDNGCEEKEDKCCNEPDESDPVVAAVLSALVNTMPNCRLRIATIYKHVDFENIAETENPLQTDGCNAVIRDRFLSSNSYGLAADFLGFFLRRDDTLQWPFQLLPAVRFKVSFVFSFLISRFWLMA